MLDLIISGSYGNPSSTHYLGRETKKIVDQARELVADSLFCDPENIIFTSGGTEANNLALRGIHFPSNRFRIAISAAEHSSVYNTAHEISPFVDIIPLKKDGSLDLDAAREIITSETALVCVMLASNETGAIFDVKKIAEMAHSVGALVHCDAVQAYGKMFVSPYELCVDTLSISGHKVHAQSGVGALFVAPGVFIRPQITGGPHERGFRAGTENYIGILSLGCAAEDILKGGYLSSALRDLFEKGLKYKLQNVTINAEDVERIPNTSSVIFHSISSAEMLLHLESYGVIASAGSACSSGFLSPVKTVLAMGKSTEDALSTVRFSFSKLSTMQDTVTALEACILSADVLRHRLN